jgi:hypothetical protein
LQPFGQFHIAAGADTGADTGAGTRAPRTKRFGVLITLAWLHCKMSGLKNCWKYTAAFPWRTPILPGPGFPAVKFSLHTQQPLDGPEALYAVESVA